MCLLLRVCLLLVGSKDAFSPVLCTRHFCLDATRPLVQIIDDVVVIIGAVIVHVLILKELRPVKKRMQDKCDKSAIGFNAVHRLEFVHG